MIIKIRILVENSIMIKVIFLLTVNNGLLCVIHSHAWGMCGFLAVETGAVLARI